MWYIMLTFRRNLVHLSSCDIGFRLFRNVFNSALDYTTTHGLWRNIFNPLSTSYLNQTCIDDDQVCRHTHTHTRSHTQACKRTHNMVMSYKLTFAYEWQSIGARVVGEGRKDVAMVTILATVVEPGYNDIGLCDTPSITSDILWYKLIPHC